MTNEGLLFGVSALGIALVIFIIVLVVRHHKDKYEDVDSGRLKDVDGGCCSLTNNPGSCGTGVPPNGGTFNQSKGCISASGKNSGKTLPADRCICNGSGTCTKDSTDGSAICSCLYNLSDTHACGTCATGYVPATACNGSGDLCSGYTTLGGCPAGTPTGYDQSCTFINSKNDQIATACVTKPPPPPSTYWCYQSFTYGGLERNLEGPYASRAAALAAGMPASATTWATLADAQAACVVGGGSSAECDSNLAGDQWCAGCEEMFGSCSSRCADWGRDAMHEECKNPISGDPDGAMYDLTNKVCVPSNWGGGCSWKMCTCMPKSNGPTSGAPS